MADSLILIGFMGSGKTTVGKCLAVKLGWDFFDADPLVEEHLGMRIHEIFEIHGEPGFRKAEEAVALGLIDQASRVEGGTVISLGGGAVTIPAVYERLTLEPLVALLDEDINMAFSRARGGRRPLATDREKFKALYAERESLYRSVAKYIVNTRGLDVEQAADMVIGLINKRTGIL